MVPHPTQRKSQVLTLVKGPNMIWLPPTIPLASSALAPQGLFPDLLTCVPCLYRTLGLAVPSALYILSFHIPMVYCLTSLLFYYYFIDFHSILYYYLSYFFEIINYCLSH